MTITPKRRDRSPSPPSKNTKKAKHRSRTPSPAKAPAAVTATAATAVSSSDDDDDDDDGDESKDEAKKKDDGDDDEEDDEPQAPAPVPVRESLSPTRQIINGGGDARRVVTKYDRFLDHHNDDLGVGMAPGYYPVRYARQFNIIVWMDTEMQHRDVCGIGDYKPRRPRVRAYLGDSVHADGDRNASKPYSIPRAGGFRHCKELPDWDELISYELRPSYTGTIKWMEVDPERHCLAGAGGNLDWTRVTQAFHSGQYKETYEVHLSSGTEGFKRDVMFIMCMAPGTETKTIDAKEESYDDRLPRELRHRLVMPHTTSAFSYEENAARRTARSIKPAVAAKEAVD